MFRKRVIIGQSEWGIPDANQDAIVAAIKQAMLNGTVVEVELLDGANRPVTVYINGAVTSSLVLDLDLGPKPTEIPGG